MNRTGFAAIGALVLSGLSTSGAAAQYSAACETRARNGMVTLVLCPPDLDLTALAAAGREACGQQRPCGAWIWDNADEIPTEAPPVHDGFTQEQVTSAEAIWVAEDGNLITIEATPTEGAPAPPATDDVDE